jgi:hypothetical protein
MRMRVAGIVAFAVVAVFGSAPAWAQVESKHEAGMSKVKTSQVTGEVLSVEGNYLIARMRPDGHFRGFNVRPGQEFMIDGQKKLIGDLKPGTVLTASLITTEQPMTLRTHDVLNGTVWFASGNYVILTDEKGENHEYTVPETYRFTVDGKPATVRDLKKGTKVQAVKIVEEPATEISTKVIVTGKAPK